MKSVKRMMLVLALIGFAPALAVAQTSELSDVQKSTKQIAKQTKFSVVAVSSNLRSNRFGFGSGSSGFLVSKKGHILTISNGLPKTGDTVTVTFAGRYKTSAKIVGQSKSTNLALLKIKDFADFQKSLPSAAKPLKLAADHKARGGQLVFTVSNPFDSIKSDGIPAVSMGIVTRRGRLLQNAGAYKGTLIETDAAVNPGSYGGPLLNLDGEVIGVLTMAYSRKRWHGTAIPVQRYLAIAKGLRKGDVNERTVLGVAVENTRGLAQVNGLKVIRVQKNSAAAKSGFKVGDRIVAIGFEKLYQAEDLARELTGIPPGETVTFEVKSADGNTFMRKVQLGSGKRMKTKPVKLPNILPKPRKTKPRASLGIALLETKNSHGLRIDGFRKNSPVKAIGARKGDLLLAIDGEKVNSFADLVSTMRSKRGGQKVKILLEREGWEHDFEVKLLGRNAAKYKLGARLGSVPGRPGLKINSVAPGSVAEKAGLKAGDIVNAWYMGKNRIALESPSDMRGAMRAANKSGKLKIDVERDGWEKVLVLNFKK